MCRYLLYVLMIFALPVEAVQKQALVIGNGDYAIHPLVNPVNDAMDVASALENLGFEVMLVTNGDKFKMSQAVQQFSKKLKNQDAALFYFSGHGVSGKDQNQNDTNFLVGSFSEHLKTDAALINESLNVNFVVRSLKEHNPDGVNIVILDACRNVPHLDQNKGVSDDHLVRLSSPQGFIIHYATQPLERAIGDKRNRNSLYTESLLKALNNPQWVHNSAVDFFNRVGLLVTNNPDNLSKQKPSLESSPVDFCFAGCGGVVQQAPVVVAEPSPASEPAPKPSRLASEPEMVLIPADKRMEKNMISTVILAGDINFEFKMMNLSPQAIAQLSALSKAVLSDEGKRQIVLIGYTDNAEGDDKNCLKLADARAMTVARTLVNNGVSPKILFVKGMGKAKPVGDNRTKEGRAKNRRVEIMIE